MSNERRAKELLAYYRQKRVDGQREFYRSRSSRFKSRDTMLRVVAGLLMLLGSGILAFLAQIFQPDAGPGMQVVWGVLLSGVPALATALLTLRSILQYDFVQLLYRQTYLNLGEVATDFEPSENDDDLEEALKTYIMEVELAVSSEQTQWVTRKRQAKPAQAPATSE